MVKRTSPTVALIILAGCTSACSLFFADSNRAILSNSQSNAVRIVLDSDDARKAVREEMARQERVVSVGNEGEHSDLQERSAFLNGFLALPAITVPVGTGIKILTTTSCRCSLHPHVTPALIEVQILNGQDRGKIGWICDTFVARSTPSL